MSQLQKLLERSKAALESKQAVLFINSVLSLAPENIPGMAKNLQSFIERSNPLHKSIVDLARLARDYPDVFRQLVGGNKMK